MDSYECSAIQDDTLVVLKHSNKIQSPSSALWCLQETKSSSFKTWV